MSEHLDHKPRKSVRPRTRVARKLVAVLTGAVLVLVMSASAASSAATYQPVVIANGWSAPDVGTAAPLAASLGGSVLYANTESLGDPTVDALSKLKPSEVILVGGTKVLTADIVTELGEVVPGVPVTRLAGDDRIHTAALAALHALGTESSADSGTGAASVASTGPGDAQDYQAGYSEARFRAGVDLRPGVWQFSRNSGSGRIQLDPTSYTNRYGGHCRHSFGEDGSNAARIYVTVRLFGFLGDEGGLRMLV
ncbi:MAG: cell wall-binding repeat-containing protein [Acidimicrobiaceae bacterium]|nr:cell wall-binding repeat-containing protein [Acidimicrobiaceae bacterium]